MSDRFAYMVQKADAFSFELLAQDMERSGISLANPATRRITVIDLEGDQQQISPSQLRLAVSEGEVITLQLWLAEDDDLICTLRHFGSNVTEWYSFANPGTAIDRLVQTFLRRIKSIWTSTGLVLAVVDIEGRTAEYPWDDFSRDPRFIPEGASLVVLPESFAGSLAAPHGMNRVCSAPAIWVSSRFEKSVRAEFTALHS